MPELKNITAEIEKDGSFKRQRNRFTTPFGKEEGQLPVEAGRYRILWAPVCPWAHRSIIVRSLLGLQDVISVGTLDPVRPENPNDWAFTLDEGNVDPVLGYHFLSEAYLKADPDYKGRFTVPSVVDLQTGAVVNNDYFNLTRYWETEWKEFHKEGAPDLYPEELRSEIENCRLVFNRLDWLEERLSHSRYLFGDRITESDVRLYVTLARFDVAYYNGFRVNLKMLKDYPNLWGYARDLYQTPGFGDTTDFEAIKKHYHLCAISTNPLKLLPLGPEEELWNTKHGRDREYH